MERMRTGKERERGQEGGIGWLTEMPVVAIGMSGGPRRAGGGHWRAVEAFGFPHPLLE